MRGSGIVFFVRRTLEGRLLGVYRLRNGLPQQWTVDGWQTRQFDWSGIGGSTDYDEATVEEACQALLELGVTTDQLPGLILGLNPEGNLAKVLGRNGLADLFR